MSTTQWPLAAVALDADGTPWYPFRSSETDAVLFLHHPRLPNPQAQWAEVPPDYADRPHMPLDEAHLAELLFFTSDPGRRYDLINPEAIDPEHLLWLLSDTLTACGCDPARLDQWLVGEYGGGVVYGGERTRMDCCRTWVHGLMAGTSC